MPTNCSTSDQQFGQELVLLRTSTKLNAPNYSLPVAEEVKMSGQTGLVLGLKEDTLNLLRELRSLNVDSAKGFEECAELVKDNGLKEAFTEIAHARRENAHVLGNQIEWNEGDEPAGGSYLASFHRAWIKVREFCSGENRESLLVEAIRGEDVIREAYEQAIGQTKSSPINGELVAQFSAVDDVCSRIKSLRKICD